MKSILVTGCNRGIGLGLIQHLSKNDKLKYIIATCRNPENAQELQAIKEQNGNVYILQAEMKDCNSIKALAESVSKIVGDVGLNVLINNAAIASKFTRINFVKEEQLLEHFQINTIAPIMMCKAFHPALKKAVQQNADKPVGASKAVIINMSSILGSIDQNFDGGYYPYRTSKTALNAASKSLSIDLKNDEIVVVSLHPGWVQTDLGGPKAPIDVNTSVTGILKFLNNITGKHNGTFYDYNGKQLPW